MSGEVPEIIRKGKFVSYKGKNVKVLDYHFSCPCVVGITDHHPTADWPVITLEGIGDIPFSSEDFAPAVSIAIPAPNLVSYSEDDGTGYGCSVVENKEGLKK
jgi:hypothetical protein